MELNLLTQVPQYGEHVALRAEDVGYTGSWGYVTEKERLRMREKAGYQWSFPGEGEASHAEWKHGCSTSSTRVEEPSSKRGVTFPRRRQAFRSRRASRRAPGP